MQARSQRPSASAGAQQRPQQRSAWSDQSQAAQVANGAAPSSSSALAPVRFAYRGRLHSLPLRAGQPADSLQRSLRAVFDQRSSAAVQNAVAKARDLARIAAASASPLAGSPTPSDDELEGTEPEDSEFEEFDEGSSFDEGEGVKIAPEPVDSQREYDVDDDDEEEDSDAGSFTPGSERSDQLRDEDAEDAAFDRAVQRAMASASQKRPPVVAPASMRERPSAAARAIAGVKKQQQQLQQFPSRPAATQAQSRRRVETDAELEERLLRELGGDEYAGRGGDDNGAAEEAAREAFWQRERERRWVEAEEKVLAEERRTLQAQRDEIEKLQAEHADLKRLQAQQQRLQQQHNQTLQRLEQERQAISRGRAVEASDSEGADDSFAQSDDQDDDDQAEPRSTYPQFEIEDESDEDSYPHIEADQDDDEDDDMAHYQALSDGENADADARGSRAGSQLFELSADERSKLADLQDRAGFSALSPAQLFHLFRRRLPSAAGAQEVHSALLYRSEFEEAVKDYCEVAGIAEDEAASRKAYLVLNRLFELLQLPSQGSDAEDSEDEDEEEACVRFASLAAGLSVLARGDREQKILLALAHFQPPTQRPGILTRSQVEAYMLAVLTVVFDLSVALQDQVAASGISLPVEEFVPLMARATAKFLFARAGFEDPEQGEPSMALEDFRAWAMRADDREGFMFSSILGSAAARGSPAAGNRIVQSSSDEEEDEEEEDEQEVDEEDDLDRQFLADQARFEAQISQLQGVQKKLNAQRALMQRPRAHL